MNENTLSEAKGFLAYALADLEPDRNLQFSFAAAAIAQAEAAERQAAALERIAALLNDVITPTWKDKDGFIRTGGV